MKWEIYQLKNIADYWTGKIDASVLDAANYVSTENLIPDKGGIVYSNYVPKSGKANSYSEKDVLISNIRPYFKKIWFADKKGGCSNDVLVFRAKENIEPLFLYYHLSQDAFFADMVAGSNGTKMPRGNKTSIMEFRLFLPPLPTQQCIASILSAYDDLIENNLKRIKLLEEKAQLHYKEIIQDSTKWDKVRLEEFVTVVKGRKPSNVLEQPEDDSQLYLLLDTVERTKTIYTSDLTLPLSKESDVLMCMDGARSGLSFRGMIGAIGSTMAIWRSNSERVSGEFLYQFMKQNESAITQGNTGAAIPHANRKFILDMKIPMPPKNEAKYYNGLTVSMLKLVNTLHNQNTKLREARDILLPRLMNGEIEV